MSVAVSPVLMKAAQQLRRLGGDPQVTSQGEGKAAAVGRTVESGQDDLRGVSGCAG